MGGRVVPGDSPTCQNNLCSVFKAVGLRVAFLLLSRPKGAYFDGESDLVGTLLTVLTEFFLSPRKTRGTTGDGGHGRGLFVRYSKPVFVVPRFVTLLPVCPSLS